MTAPSVMILSYRAELMSVLPHSYSGSFCPMATYSPRLDQSPLRDQVPHANDTALNLFHSAQIVNTSSGAFQPTIYSCRLLLYDRNEIKF